MSTYLTWLANHGAAVAIAAFTISGIILNAIAGVLQALGKQVPGSLGTAISWVGKILHWLNGTIVNPQPVSSSGPQAGPGPTGT